MNSRVRMIYAVAFCVLLFAGGAKSQAQEEVYEFSLQTGLPNSSLYFGLLEDFAEELERVSGGRLVARVLPDGAELGAFDILDGVHDGVVEAGYAWPHYWSGKHSAFVLFSNSPASTGIDQASLVAWFYAGEGAELYRELTQEVMGYDTVHYLVQPMGPDPLGWFSEPFEDLESFRRLKYRAPPGIAGRTYNEMGIPAVAMPGSDLVPAAERGTIDAAEWIGPADDRHLGLNNIWDYYYLQGLHQQTDVGELILNREWFEGLPDDLQAIIEMAAKAHVTDTTSTNMVENARAVRAYKEEGVEVLDTPEDYFPAFIEAQNRIIQGYREEDDFFARVYDAQVDFAELVYDYHSSNMGVWRSVVEGAHQVREEE